VTGAYHHRTTAGGHQQRRLALCVLAILVLFAMTGCAQQGAPQGGPPDTIPPTVLSTEPATGAVSVGRNTVIAIEFSESIDRATLLPSLLLSPPRMGQPEAQWSEGGRHVRLTWADSLRADATYRVTVGGRTTDSHSNPFKSPFTFAFSTGDAVDIGCIVGKVKSPDEKVGVVDIFAYRTDRLTDTFWLDPPDYLTQTGERGAFDLPYLKGGTCRLLAMADANRNHQLDPGERFGLAREIETRDSLTPDSVFIFTSVYDTTVSRLAGCAMAAGGGITLTFSRPIDTTNWNRAEFRVRDSLTGENLPITAVPPSIRHPAAVLLLSDSLVAGRRYMLLVQNLYDQQGRTMAGPDSCRVTYQVLPDSVGPRVEWVYLPTLKQATSPRGPILWSFSEPVDSTRLREGISVKDSSGGVIAGGTIWSDPRTVRFWPTGAWPESTTIVVTIDSLRLADRSGNAAPKQPFRWTFAPLTSSAMGTLEGRVEVRDSSGVTIACQLQLQAVGAETRVTHTVEAPGSFSFDLPAGRWILGGFLDLDGDHHWNPGTLRPYLPPEPRVLRDDTLTVRARFTLEDVTLRF
jgi:hypothetical protein